MKTLNERYNYGLDLFLLSIDEGITGYRDDSLEVYSACLKFACDLIHWLIDCQTKSAAI